MIVGCDITIRHDGRPVVLHVTAETERPEPGGEWVFRAHLFTTRDGGSWTRPLSDADLVRAQNLLTYDATLRPRPRLTPREVAAAVLSEDAPEATIEAAARVVEYDRGLR